MKAETTESTPPGADDQEIRASEDTGTSVTSTSPEAANHPLRYEVATLPAVPEHSDPDSSTLAIDIAQIASANATSPNLTLDANRKATLVEKIRTVVPSIGLDDRAGRIVLSILLAVLLWFYVVNLENPSQTTVFNDLTVDVRGLSPGLKLINTLSAVKVTVQAPQNILSALRPGDVHPFIDLAGITAGVHTFPVQVEIVNPQAGSMSVSTNPGNVQVQIEIESTRDLPVEVRITGTPAFGYSVDPAQADPSTVRITGSQDIVGRVAKVITTVNVDAQGGTLRGSRTPIALDENGNEIAGLTFAPVRVQVVVPIKLGLTYKVIGVRADTRGQPAPGYRVSAITTDPNTITACCDPNVLNDIKFLDTLPVPITGTTSDVITQTQLLLPANVELYPGQTKVISVTINVVPLVTTLQVPIAPTVQGAPTGAGVVISPDHINLTLAGTFDQLQGLKPTDVTAIIDVSGKGPGTYDLVPQITVPRGVTLESTSLEKLTVTILAPTPVPTSTPEPTSTPHPSPTRQPTSTPVELPTTSLPSTATEIPSTPTAINTPTVQPTATVIVQPSATPTLTATTTAIPGSRPTPSP